MSDDPRVMAVAVALADPSSDLPDMLRASLLGLSMVPLAEVAVAALDAFDNSAGSLRAYRRQVERGLRERIAQEIEAAHRAAPDCCAYDVAARIARGQA